VAKQSLAGYVRQHLAEIEHRIKYCGISQSVIVEELNELGYATTLQIFRNTLSRARACRSEQTSAEVVVNKPAQQPAAPKSSASSFDYKGSPDDEELSKLI
jgi:hypothetical protein